MSQQEDGDRQTKKSKAEENATAHDVKTTDVAAASSSAPLDSDLAVSHQKKKKKKKKKKSSF
jgi:hypothetical protein